MWQPSPTIALDAMLIVIGGVVVVAALIGLVVWLW